MMFGGVRLLASVVVTVVAPLLVGGASTFPWPSFCKVSAAVFSGVTLLLVVMSRSGEAGATA